MSRRSRGPKPTDEQLNAIDLFFDSDALAIEAGAGTGKTSTLVMLSNEVESSVRGQYIAYNRSIVDDTKGKFPRNIACQTAHSLAFRAVGVEYQGRLNGQRMRGWEIARELEIQAIKIEPQGLQPRFLSQAFLASHVQKALQRFCYSADPEPMTKHFPFVEGIDRAVGGKQDYENNNWLSSELMPALKLLWLDAQDPTGRFPFTHDYYLKMWQLQKPKIDADFIMLDEAQDANPVIVAIVAAQTHAQLVWVGDTQQQIYAWRGAINALGGVPADRKAFLTLSFRFGHAIAEVANTILRSLGAELVLRGSDKKSSVIELEEPHAVLARTNAGLVERLLQERDAGFTPTILGGAYDLISFARGAGQLQRDGHTSYHDLTVFKSWEEVQDYANNDAHGQDLKVAVKLVDRYGPQGLEKILANLPREEEADVILSTAHKAKGREWRTVMLADDFPVPGEEELPDEEKRLLYVATTRAERSLDISNVRTAIYGYADEQPAEEKKDEPERERVGVRDVPAVDDHSTERSTRSSGGRGRQVRRRSRPRRVLIAGSSSYPEPRHISREVKARLDAHIMLLVGDESSRFEKFARATIKGEMRNRPWGILPYDTSALQTAHGAEPPSLEDYVLQMDEVVLFFSGGQEDKMRALFNAIFDSRTTYQINFPDGRRETHHHGEITVEKLKDNVWQRRDNTWIAPDQDIVTQHDRELTSGA